MKMFVLRDIGMTAVINEQLSLDNFVYIDVHAFKINSRAFTVVSQSHALCLPQTQVFLD